MYKGIYQLPSDHFQVKITYEGRRYNLGTYPDEPAALEAIKLFKTIAEDRSEAERDERAQTLRESARLKQSRSVLPKAKPTTMRQDVKSSLERIAQLERQVKGILLHINGGNG